MPVALERLASALGEVIFIVDSKLLIHLAVGASELLAGAPEKLVGLPLAFALSDGAIDDIRAAWSTGAFGALPSSARVRALDGSDVPVRVWLVSASDPAMVAVVLRHVDKTERDLENTNRFLDAIIENLPAMIFVKDAKTLIFERFNRAGEELLGWSRQDLIGKTDHDFYPKEQADFFREKDRETLRNKRLVDIPEEPIETRDKQRRWLHTKKVPVLDEHGDPLYLLGISEDITDRRQAAERVRSLTQQLAAIVDAVPAAVITWSLDGTIVSWNPGAKLLYGLSASQAKGRSFFEFVPKPEHDRFRERLSTLTQRGHVPAAVVYRLIGGFEVEIEETLFVVDSEPGQAASIGCTARDHTAQERLHRAAEAQGNVHRIEHIPKTQPTSPMDAVYATVEAVAKDPFATVLLLGETGVGKGFVARLIHDRSARAKRPFFEVNCASLGAQLVESELFGHERGAFTGAATQKRGLVEAADGGTLFLDEVGELPLPVQAQLLTFLDDKSFRRVGGTRALTANVRILAATNRNLQEAMTSGAFRRDLYYRLNVIPLAIPALRDRRADIPNLSRRILSRLARRDASRPEPELGPGVLQALQRYSWAGNVRELKNALERATILSGGLRIETRHLALGAQSVASEPPSILGTLAEVERVHIEHTLSSVQGNRTQAAQLLGISRSTLKRKLSAMRRPQS